MADKDSAPACLIDCLARLRNERISLVERLHIPGLVSEDVVGIHIEISEVEKRIVKAVMGWEQWPAEGMDAQWEG